MSARLDAGTYPAMLERNAATHPDAPVYSWFEGTMVRTLSWHRYRERVLDVATAFQALAIGRGSTVGVLAGNRIEHLIADMAAVHCGAACLSIYATLSDEQLGHVVGDAAVGVVIVENRSAVERLTAIDWIRENDTPIVVLDGQVEGAHTWLRFEQEGAWKRAGEPGDVDRAIASIDISDPLIYVYTSGTTGQSKGVLLTQANVLASVEALSRTRKFTPDYRSVSVLPLAHILERVWTIYLPLATGGHVFLCPDPARLVPALREHRPTVLVSVPRVWEKLRRGLEQVLATELFAQRIEEITADRAVLSTEWDRQQHGRPVGMELAEDAQRARTGVLRSLRGALGLDSVRVTGSGAAAMSDELRGAMASLGLDVAQGYGLTETAGVATIDPAGSSGRPGSVGKPTSAYEFRIAEDGEILIRSAANTPGYRNRPDATAELYRDGWLLTGDLGHLDQDGFLYITGRRKELIVNASGKNIAPTTIEQLLVGRSFIDHALVYGEARPYVVALFTADPGELAAFATANGIVGTSDLAAHPLVLAEVQRIVDDANAKLSRPEQVRKFTLLPTPWGPGSGELTPTQKLRRRAVHDKYSAVLDALYGPSQP
ncbi:AMP-binding protein [Nocardia sp. AG03]|uniref:AMP-dependent synthetase/ligase n=1 Tax=Nocardia sp. AG03 TaxID=3025312 RepID=UPI0024184935|nr:AMP-binding protein [Nocardia sp. AG03]